MALTRPKIYQFDTSISNISDPITVLHSGATSANVDVGFLFNRANGLVPNVAIYWSESTGQFVTAITDSTGATNSNISATSYANIKTGNITAAGFFWSNGASFSSSNYGNTDVSAYLPIDPTITGIQGNLGSFQTYANLHFGDSTYGNTQVGAYIPTNSTITGIQANLGAYQSWANTRISTLDANLGTATTNITTLFSNAAGQANQITGANNAIVTANSAVVSFVGTINNNLSIAITANTNAANTAATTANTNMKSYVDGQITSVTNSWTSNAATQAGQIQTLDANLGTATTNIATLFGNAATQATAIQTLDANLGTATTNITTLFSNAGTQQTSLNSINANVGAYETWANSRINTLDANLGTATTNITNLQSNAGSQQTQINSLATGANANVAAYLPTYSGSLGSLTTLATSGNATIGGNLSVTGNLNVLGTTTTFNSNNVSFNDAILYLVDGNSADILDIGLVGAFTNGGYQHTGIVRDATDGIWKLFGNVTTEPTTTVDFTNAVYSPLRIGPLTASSATISGTLQIGTITDVAANLATTVGRINTIDANLGVVNNNITTLFSNAATQSTSIQTLDANLGTATTNITTLFSNAGSQATSINSINANVGAYETWANTRINTLDANLGTATTNITTLFSNAGTQQTQINSIVTNANANVAAYLPTYSGSLGGTLTTAAQTNITSVGTLTGLSTSGNVSVSGNILMPSSSLTASYIQLGPALKQGWDSSGSQISGTGYIFLNQSGATYAQQIIYARSGLGNDNGTKRLTISSLSPLDVANTTTSTSTTTGALVVSGGVGVVGQITAGNIVTTSGVYWANGAAYSSGSGGGITYTAAASAPTSPSAGNFWYDTGTDIKYQYINDGTSSYWVDQSFPTSFGNLTVANTLTVGGTINGTVSNANYALAANVSIYESVTATTTNATFYPHLSDKTDGNTSGYTSSLFAFNPSTGNLVVGGTTTSTTTTTGALVVKGGAGIGGNLNVGTTANNIVRIGTIWQGANTSAVLGQEVSRHTLAFSSWRDSQPDTYGSKIASINYASYAPNPYLVQYSDLAFYTLGSVPGTVDSTTERMRIDRNGNVGIGTSSPLSTLQVVGTVAFSGNTAVESTIYSKNLLLQGDGTNAYIRPRNAASSLYLGAADSNYVHVTATQTIFTGNVVPLGNLAYNLGTPTAWWNNVYGKAVQAQYADLAEHYTADAEYPPGTVVIFGGTEEITTSDISHDPRTAGVISTDPAYLMNASSKGLPVALTGRVPCRVQGPVSKGDRLVNISAGVAGRLNPDLYEYGCIIGKSLGSIDDNSVQVIEIAVGRY